MMDALFYTFLAVVVVGSGLQLVGMKRGWPLERTWTIGFYTTLLILGFNIVFQEVNVPQAITMIGATATLAYFLHLRDIRKHRTAAFDAIERGMQQAFGAGLEAAGAEVTRIQVPDKEAFHRFRAFIEPLAKAVNEQDFDTVRKLRAELPDEPHFRDLARSIDGLLEEAARRN